MKDKLRVYIGYDSREVIAYDVLKNSIQRHATSKIDIIPLSHKELRRKGWFRRPWQIDSATGNWVDAIDGKPFSTEFSHTRFLVPSLNGYKGWALFMDADMIFTDNIKKLFDLCDDKYAVMCVKHNHKPDNTVKMDGCVQTRYFRKNWSSFMLFNCGHPANRALTPEKVNLATGSWLHSFQWLNEREIGALPAEYNWIEGISKSNVKPSVVHYTEGGPWFDGYKEVMHANLWWMEYEAFMKSGEYKPIAETVVAPFGEYVI